jgi:hypothetical protein
MTGLFPKGAWAAHNKDMRRAGHLAAVAAIMAASCTASVPSAAPSTTKSFLGSSPARLAAGAPCPVTRPTPHASPPAQMAAIPPLPVPYIHGWHGNFALWMGVPTGGVLPAQRDYQWPGEWGTKFPWWRAIPGTLTITARRLDGPSAGFHGESTFYAQADDGAVWSGPYGVLVPYHAFNDWCWDLGVSPGLSIGMRLVEATNAWFPWVGTINLT